MPEFVILADDLSGACDTAVQFSSAGYKTIVINKASNFSSLDSSFDVVSLSTNSRDTTPQEAREKIKESCYYLKGLKDTTLYKKIDSTWRGNIGVELEVILKELDFGFALISSAYPKNKRVGLGGYLLVDGQLLHHTPMAKDPASPIKEGYLPDLLREQTKLPVEHLNLQMIEKGVNEIKKYILEKLNVNGPCLFIADALEENHLDTIAGLGKEELPSYVLVGSAGLSKALLRQKNSRALDNEYLPVLTVIGSVHPNSNLQVDEMIKKQGVMEIYLPAHNLLGSQEGLKELANEAIGILNRGEDLVIRTSRTVNDVELVKSEGIRLGLGNLEITNQVALSLQKFMIDILGKVQIAGLMVTGGATALQLLEGTQAFGIEVSEEIEPGVPIGKIVGGICDGLKIITKAGGFGSSQVFCHGAEILKQKERYAK
ncbi:MAG: four-carbon acid sugar kinase family protein [Peptococcales bacterium]